MFICLAQIANAGQQGDWEPWELGNQELTVFSSKNVVNNLEVTRRVPRLFAVGIVRFYQIIISPQLMPSCNFIPSCSHYSVQALKRYGMVEGMLMTLDRLQRCHYWIQYGWYAISENGLFIDPIVDHAIYDMKSK